MSDRKVINGNGTIRPGEEVFVNAATMAKALQGQVWGMPDANGTEFDVEFTGESYEDVLVLKVKRRSEKQPKLP